MKEQTKNNNAEIEELKKEIIKTIEPENDTKKKTKLQWDSAVVTFILVSLVAVAAIQVSESTKLLQKLNSRELNLSGNSGVSVPSSVENLPDMVGGC